MTEEQAQKLGHYILDAGLDGQVYRIGNGEHVLRVKPQDFWLWNFADWTVYAHDLKTQRNKLRKDTRAFMNGINPADTYQLAMPALI